MPGPIDDRDDETRLVRRARKGHETAFAELYKRHARAVHTLALRLTGNPAAAEDITQEAFLKMLRFLNGLRDDAPLRPWLKRVAANAAIDRLRSERRLSALEDDDARAGDGPDPQLHAESLGLLRRLTPLERTVIWLHSMEGWSHPELGKRFGRSESWSKSIVSRGLSRLRAELERQDTDDDT